MLLKAKDLPVFLVVSRFFLLKFRIFVAHLSDSCFNRAELCLWRSCQAAHWPCTGEAARNGGVGLLLQWLQAAGHGTGQNPKP
jgi:hypothetical protein